MGGGEARSPTPPSVRVFTPFHLSSSRPPHPSHPRTVSLLPPCLPQPARPGAPRGRLAPSPTGRLHAGNARTALAAWLSVRAAGGRLVLRVEDLDPPRVVPGMARSHLEDLRWLGLDWDEGPDVGGPAGPYLQSERGALYEAALAELAAAGRLFPCRRSRKDLERLASAPHGPEGHAPYPASFRPARLAPGWFDGWRRGEGEGAALRFLVAPGEVIFHDRVQGAVAERVDQTVGDFVLKRRDGLHAYQLAVVVDDLRMGIDEVVRGADLLGSTARQIQLFAALGGTPPRFAHVPLLLDDRGEKLSKSSHGFALGALREAGVRPASLVGYLAWSLGLRDRPRPVPAGELVADFAWQRVGREPWLLPAGLAQLLRELQGD